MLRHQHVLTALLAICLSAFACLETTSAQVAIKGRTVYTMAGRPIANGLVLIEGDKIAYVGPKADTKIPEGFQVLTAEVVTPGLIDAHSVVGLAGALNQDEDQDQLEGSEPIQPALRAIDAYNGRDPLVAWIRSFGVTTIHTGHAPGELISGQSMVTKTVGNRIEDSVLVPQMAIVATLSEAAQKSGPKSPGTRGKMVAMLREQLLKAQEYKQKVDNADEESKPARDLKMEALVSVLNGDSPMLVTADRAQDISNALRLAEEFGFRLWLDSGAEAYLLIDEIKAAGVPVFIHPSMARATGERENLSFETAAKLVDADIPVVMQSGFEAYVPKTRVVLFEAALTAANGLSFEQALATITIDAAKILGIDERVGSLEVGKDADVAMYDGDPFEYTSHCVGVVIDGKIVSEEKR